MTNFHFVQYEAYNRFHEKFDATGAQPQLTKMSLILPLVLTTNQRQMWYLNLEYNSHNFSTIKCYFGSTYTRQIKGSTL